MPAFPTIPVISAGTEILSQGINALVQSGENAKNRRFANWQYDKQRQDALADYAMQNEYNSPASQMERLKAAGLNPNLVYGNGANSPSATVRGSSTSAPSVTAPRVDIAEGLNRYMQTKMQQLQSDNLKAQNTVLTEQAKNIAADTTMKLFSGNLKEFDFNLKTQLRNNMISKAWETTKNLNLMGNLTAAQIANTNERTKTEVAARAPKIRQIIQSTSESLQRVINLRVQAAKSQAEISYIYTQISNAQKEGKLKDAELKLRESNLSFKDPAWIRMAEKILRELGL